MKALTVLQPWAALIVSGAKPYEFRSWRPHAALIGQRIVIHAAKRELVQAEVQRLFYLMRDGAGDGATAGTAIETCLDADKAVYVLQRGLDGSSEPLQTQAGIGTAVIGSPRLAQEIAEELGVPRVNDSDRDHHALWAWPMLDPELWLAPIPMRGAQGFWTWPDPEQLLGLHPVSRPANCGPLPSGAQPLQSSPGRASSVPAAARR
jgi:hypothetical protein